MSKAAEKPDYGVDAPAVLRNLLVIGAILVLLAIFGPNAIHLGSVTFLLHPTFGWTGGFLFVEGLLMLLYVKWGKMKHRDRMLALHMWRGDEQVLDVGTGRGLLLAGAAKRLTSGHATGIDIWSNVDMGGNSAEATERNLRIEGVTDRCTLVSEGAQQMNFADGSFDVIVSNLCLHNIYDKPTRLQALQEIVRVLKPGGMAIISDYKRTREYAAEFAQAGLGVERKSPDWLRTFPALSIVIAKKN